MRTIRGLVSCGLGALLVATMGGSAVAQDGPYETALETSLSYGDDAKQVIHAVTLEPREEPRPAPVFFHGGGLVMGQPTQDLGWAEWLASHGYVSFLAGYRLFESYADKNPWPAQLDDAQAAVRWVREHADEFNVDPERISAV